MRLEQPFLRLPIRFDAERLAQEVSSLPEQAWRAHPQGYAGNSALPLVAAYGDAENDETRGPMRATPWLQHLPYVRQIMAALGAPIGRSRLMRIEGNGEAHAHVDSNYYWMSRMRVHVPVITQPEVAFIVGERRVHMAAGECWIFDTWSRHNVINPLPSQRIHLVMDTAGSPALAALIDHAECPAEFHPRANAEARLLNFAEAATALPEFEMHNHPVVMTPEELASWCAFVLSDLRAGQRVDQDVLTECLHRLQADWQHLFARYGLHTDGFAPYRQRLTQLDQELATQVGRLQVSNRSDAVEILRQCIVRAALNPELATSAVAPAVVPRAAPTRFDRPVFIVCPPRSGSSLLFETLSRSPDVFTVGGESHQIIEQIPGLHPARHHFDSNRLLAEAATETTVAELQHGFFSQLRNRDGKPVRADARALRFLEKTPKNALRLPFLAKAFPDARFVYLYRDARDTISSMLDAWRSRKFVTYPNLPGWSGSPWSLLLPPGWREWIDKPLNEVVARQWAITTRCLLDDLVALPAERVFAIAYADLLANPQAEIERLCAALDLAWDQPLSELPLSRHTLTPPDPDKWRKNDEALREALPIAEPMAKRAAAVFADYRQRPASAAMPRRVPDPSAVQAVLDAARPMAARWQGYSAPAANESEMPSGAQQAAFGSVYTQGFAEMLRQAGIALAVSTYQSGRVVLVRAEGQGVNTHFKSFPSPMGLAARGSSLVIATARGLWEYQNQPGMANSLDASGRVDACYLPRRQHVTGDIRVHEIAFAERDLWIVNTRFSCLCTLDGRHSFVPRWWPKFISKLEATDRCHLNGLAVVDDRVRFVSCLAPTDVAGGWREHKADGGILIDVPSGEIVVRGLSMPHSPRWHQGKLWVLESGLGALSTVDPVSGQVTRVLELPGFVRGLSFHGPFAFIGLSQVREGVFGGLPLMERLTERLCGVWLVDLRQPRIVGFLRFEGQVQEIFDITVLPDCRYPELLEPEDERVAASFMLPALP